jgi:pimeloyl-ACP methyl ester carboxylesterase
VNPSDFEHHFAHVNGIQMHYAQAGHGPRLLVLLHGFPQCWWMWRHQLALFQPALAATPADRERRAALAERYTAIAPDLRGYNQTDQPRWGYEIDVLAQDVVELARALGHTRAVIAGHDWGGMIAWSLAIARAPLVERLVVANAPHPALFAAALGSNWRQMLRSWYFAFFQLPFLPELVLRAGNFAALERIFRATAFNKAAFANRDVQIYKEALAKPHALTAAIDYYREIMRQGARGMYHGTGMRVEAPSLLIWGEDDSALGKELTYGTKRFAPDLRVRYIPRCSHWVVEEQPELVSQYMLEFLA